jgi:hypothetical protein
MSEPTILFCKPKAISPADRKVLEKRGVLVVEVADPQSVRLVKPHAELDAGELLLAAVKAIDDQNSITASARTLFGGHLCDAIKRKAENPETKR